MDKTVQDKNTNISRLQDTVRRLLSIVPSYIYDTRTLSSQAAIKLADITQSLSTVFPLLIQLSDNENVSSFIDEFKLIIEAILTAQQNEDRILCADIMECDFIPFLHRLVIFLDQCFETDISIASIASEDDRITFCSSINGETNAVICAHNKSQYLHSTNDPTACSKTLARSLVNESTYNFCVLGMGLGYEVLALLEENLFVNVKVYEYNRVLYDAALSNIDFSKYENRLELIFEPDVRKAWNSICRDKTKDYTHILLPQLLLIDDLKLYTILNEYIIQLSNQRYQDNVMQYNFSNIQSRNIPECEVLRPLIQGRDTIILGGGPSLNHVLPKVRSVRDNYAIIAVGRAVGALSLQGIVPDIVVISDPTEIAAHQLDTLSPEVPLVLLSTAQSSYLDSYSGEKFVAYQEGYALSERYAKDNNLYTYKVGGSVSSLALDMAFHFLSKSITLVGIDLAYVDNAYHAQGSGDETTSISSSDPTVTSNDGKTLFTSDVFIMYQKVMEDRIALAASNEFEKDIIVYNTGYGAKIAGTTWIPAII